jgi:autotransporter-associated beta strand protein
MAEVPSIFKSRVAALAVVALLSAARPTHAALTFTVEAGGWPDAARRNAAVSALQSAVNRYNAYGNFGNYNVYAYYNAGIPTAQANYLGSIGYGGTYPNERVTLHEMSHYLGTGTYGTPWDGFRGESLVDQFDGLDASLNGDGVHYWPYGLNFDSEGAEINKQRHVALLYAMRADMGIGSTAIPGGTVVNLTASDPVNESGFNYASRWSDAHFAHAGAAYTTGEFALRTPQGYPSWTFAGESLTVNNTTAAGGLRYNSWGTTGVITIKNLNLNGGSVRHDQFSQDLFQLAGRVTLTGNSTFDAGQGNIRLLGDVRGAGSLVKTGANTLALRGGATYAGDTTINAGTLRLEAVPAVALYTFDNVSGSTVINEGSGGSTMNGALTGGATIVPGGRFGNAVSVAGGASVNINNPIVDLRHDGNWTVSAWVKTSTAGGSILTKNNGSGWGNGNTIFYLGDGTAGGSGGRPSAVRWAGGFYQESAAATPVNDNTWRQVTYVNSGGNYALYVDGAAQPLSSGNSSFANFDIGTMIRMGVSTNTVVGDGTLNFNGLLDSVQFYNQALSGPQISALYEGASVTGSLPTTTNVTIASGATLDLNGVTQQIDALTGPAGSIIALGGGRLVVNTSAHSVFSGTITGGGALTKGSPGAMTLTGASVFAGGTTVDGGTLVANNASGSATGSGPVAVAFGSTLAGFGRIGGSVTNDGVVNPNIVNVGSDADGLLLAQNYTQQPDGKIKIDLASPTDFGRLTVTGQATLAGTLELALADGFVPAPASFDILDWGTLVGNFDTIEHPLLPGFDWDFTQLYTTGVVSLGAAGFAADFDNDGDVDADDLTRWQTGFGAGTTRDQGDADGDLDVDGDDFLAWQRQLGSGPGASPVNSAVPEPAGLALLLSALGAGVAIRKRTRTERLTARQIER